VCRLKGNPGPGVLRGGWGGGEEGGGVFSVFFLFHGFVWLESAGVDGIVKSFESRRCAFYSMHVGILCESSMHVFYACILCTYVCTYACVALG
jgi:hypothetical protein